MCYQIITWAMLGSFALTGVAIAQRTPAAPTTPNNPQAPINSEAADPQAPATPDVPQAEQPFPQDPNLPPDPNAPVKPRAPGGGNAGDFGGRDAGGSGRFQGFGMNPLVQLTPQQLQQFLQLSPRQMAALQQLYAQLQQAPQPLVDQGQLSQNPAGTQQQPGVGRDQAQPGRFVDPNRFRELLEGEQITRFQQMQLRQNPFLAFEDASISDQLNLKPSQLRRVQVIQRAAERDVRRLIREQPDDFDDRLEQARQEAIDNIEGVLDQEQALVWRRLLGSPGDAPGDPRRTPRGALPTEPRDEPFERETNPSVQDGGQP